jgi:uncharacterized protein YjbI with pentapeptide repeats
VLAGTNLREAVLREADLIGADLGEAELREADLFDADLSEANLGAARLVGANLAGAVLFRADLTGADVHSANLSAADLGAANLSGANLGGVEIDMRAGAPLVGAVSLSGAALMRTNLSGARLRGVDLSGTFLYQVDLTGADLFAADLNEAALIEVDLAGADLTRAQMGEALYEPVSAPVPETMSRVTGLSSLRWADSPHGLNLLRQAFRDAGMRGHERQVTYALRHWQRLNAGGLQGALTYVLFEATCAWGLAPGRPLELVLLLILVFAAPYLIAVMRTAETGSGIWRVWAEDGAATGGGKREPVRVQAGGYAALLWALYVSVLSALHLARRDPNVGGWIACVHPGDYAVRPTGWVKTVSAVQSLVSLYLIALSALSHFARPFG